MEQPKYTPTQQRMLAVLADGMRHTKEELISCLWDEMGTIGTVNVHLTYLRKILRPMGQDIICENDGRRRNGYRHVRLLKSPYKE